MASTKSVVTTATRLLDASSRDSGRISEKTIQIIAPPANPSPIGNRGSKKATKRKAGTAMTGCGKEIKEVKTGPLPLEHGTTRMATLLSIAFLLFWTSALILFCFLS
jgi:hypothetical protein